MQFERSRLVQRLYKATGRPSPFAFGASGATGGLSREALEAVAKVVEFEYMGASEYENGAVPATLRHISANSSTYVTAEIAVTVEDAGSVIGLAGDFPVYLICPAEHAEAAADRVREWAKGVDNSRDGVLLRESLQDPNTRRCGWIDLTNHFLVFTDEAAWQGMAELLRVVA